MQELQAATALRELRKLSGQAAERTCDYKTAFMSTSAFAGVLASRAAYGAVLMTLIALFGAVLPDQSAASHHSSPREFERSYTMLQMPSAIEDKEKRLLLARSGTTLQRYRRQALVPTTKAGGHLCYFSPCCPFQFTAATVSSVPFKSPVTVTELSPAAFANCSSAPESR
jgi:hypothetical protein